MTPRAPPHSASRVHFSIALRFLVFVAGGAVVILLVRAAGPERVYILLQQAWPWLPAVIACEMLMVTTDLLALRALLGQAAERTPRSAWVRSSTFAYAAMIILPAGRAAGETIRAATLAPSVGAARATGACARLQSCIVFGNTVASLVTASFAYRYSTILALALLANGLACALIGSAILLLARSERFAAWLRKRFAKFVATHTVPPQAQPHRWATVLAIALAVTGRAVQTVQYGIAIHAVGLVATPVTTIVAQGIHLVGAAFGDLVPIQLGMTEGAYRAFASALGLQSDTARALSIALVARVAQLILATTCLGVGSLVPRPAKLASVGSEPPEPGDAQNINPSET
jgi:hypothetical protein